jgi:predicted nucleotidyltransferase
MAGSSTRYHTADHIERRRLTPGAAEGARADAARIAAFRREHNGAEVLGIGSLFEGLRPFTSTSDIDLVVRGLPRNRFLGILAEIDALSRFEVNIIPWEDANNLAREIVARDGVPL